MQSQMNAGATVGEIVAVMERLAPPFLAENWDNCGLQVGSRSWPAHRIRLALDPLPQVVSEAVQQKIQLLITHHPLLFQPLRSIDLQTPTGRIIETALAGRLAIYSAHTNLDSVGNGVNDALAAAVGLGETKPLVGGPRRVDDPSPDGVPSGMGRIGRLPRALPLGLLAENIRNGLGLDILKVAGDLNLQVDRVAVCSGSGSSLLQAFLESDAQVYVSGDLRYHDARKAEEFGRGLVDIGHFHSERLVFGTLAERLRQEIRLRGWAATVDLCRLEKEPFVHLSS